MVPVHAHKIRSVAEKEGHEALMNYLYVESMAVAEKLGITQGQAMDFFDWRMKTEFAQMKPAYGVRHDEGDENVGNYVQDPGNAESSGLAVEAAAGEETGRAIQEIRTDERDGFFDPVVLLVVNTYNGWHHDFDNEPSAMGVSVSCETTQSGPEERGIRQSAHKDGQSRSGSNTTHRGPRQREQGHAGRHPER